MHFEKMRTPQSARACKQSHFNEHSTMMSFGARHSDLIIYSNYILKWIAFESKSLQYKSSIAVHIQREIRRKVQEYKAYEREGQWTECREQMLYTTQHLPSTKEVHPMHIHIYTNAQYSKCNSNEPSCKSNIAKKRLEDGCHCRISIQSKRIQFQRHCHCKCNALCVYELHEPNTTPSFHRTQCAVQAIHFDIYKYICIIHTL